MSAPIIVGGNGHSGTRLFAEILMSSGVFMGYSGISYDKNSKDLNIRSLMNRWMKPYLLGLPDAELRRMRRQFRRRLRILLPIRSGQWGFKNPRSMFLLPFYHELFPDMRFIHVIRDGRDMCFGNPFIESPTYWGILTEEEATSLSPEERMIRFWGEGNRKVREFATANLRDRYLMIRFEDICDNPRPQIEKILDLVGASKVEMDELVSLVRKPSSIGRWKTYPEDDVNRVISLGRDYLLEFGYL